MTTSRMFDKPMVYQFRVYGRLERDWFRWFDDFRLLPQEDDEMIIEGIVADQAALHGLLARIQHLGLPLLAVTQMPPSPSDVVDPAESA